jgi:hypothetical protein
MEGKKAKPYQVRDVKRARRRFDHSPANADVDPGMDQGASAVGEKGTGLREALIKITHSRIAHYEARISLQDIKDTPVRLYETLMGSDIE